MSESKRESKLTPHPVVEKLVPEPGSPADVVQIVGYIGRSARPEHYRVYMSLQQLDEYVDVPVAAVVHHEDVPDTEMAHGGTRLWLQASAEVVHETRQSTRTEARFLEGSIADEYLQDAPADPQGGFDQPYTPYCQTKEPDCTSNNCGPVTTECAPFGRWIQTRVTNCDCPWTAYRCPAGFGTPATRVTCPTRCLQTCGFTCMRTCGRTCVQQTCGATCVRTCFQTCRPTCARTCGPTCFATCQRTCFGTCQPTCNTCGIACTRFCTRDVQCTEPRTAFCPRTQVCPGPQTIDCPVVTRGGCPQPSWVDACPSALACPPDRGMPSGDPINPGFGAPAGASGGWGAYGAWAPDPWADWYGWPGDYGPWST